MKFYIFKRPFPTLLYVLRNASRVGTANLEEIEVAWRRSNIASKNELMLAYSTNTYTTYLIAEIHKRYSPRSL